MVNDTCLIFKEDAKIRLPRISFLDIKNKILGSRYNLSISIVTPRTSRKLNKKFRGKDHPTTILSFPLSTSTGEIILEPVSIRAQASEFGSGQHDFFTFLFIHGLLHLALYEHSSKMKQAERKWCRYFNITYPEHS